MHGAAAEEQPVGDRALRRGSPRGRAGVVSKLQCEAAGGVGSGGRERRSGAEGRGGVFQVYRGASGSEGGGTTEAARPGGEVPVARFSG